MLHPVNVLFAYVGPETMLPLASGLAAILGALLFSWRWVVGLLRMALSKVIPGFAKREAEPPEVSAEIGTTPPSVPPDRERTGTPGTR